MKSKLARSIFDLVRTTGRSESVTNLERRGVRSVRLLGADQIAALIEQSLDRALQDRLLEITDHERAKLLDRARDEFERLRAQVQGLETEAERKRRELLDVESRLSDLSGDFQKANASLDAEILAAMTAPTAPVVDPRDELEVLTRVVNLAGIQEPSLAARVAGAIAKHLAAEREKAAAEAAKTQRERVEMLERRLAKLTETLERTEQQLAVAIENAQNDPGVESIYRTVQGLKETAKDFQRKRAMLSEIFSKNFMLQKGAATA